MTSFPARSPRSSSPSAHAAVDIPLSPTLPPHLSLRPDERPYETRDLPSSPPRRQHQHQHPVTFSSTYTSGPSRTYSYQHNSNDRNGYGYADGGQSASASTDTNPYPRAPLSIRRSSVGCSPRAHPGGAQKQQSHSRPSFIDEILPTPSSGVFSEKMRGLPITSDHDHDHATGIAHAGSGGETRSSRGEFARLIRRSGSIGVIFCFLLAASWLAATDSGGRLGLGVGLREALGRGRLGVPEIALNGFRSSQGDGAASEGDNAGAGAGAHGHGHGLGYGQVETDDEVLKSKPDFDQYIMLRTLPSDLVSTTKSGHRVIIIGDIHGSFVPLQNLLRKLSYDPSTDTLLHVGDLLAKGPMPGSVLDYMSEHKVYGVRGNHDQPVVRWRAWMEHAGGMGWRDMMDQVGKQSEKDARAYFEKKGKEWPKGWEWKGEHWKIARESQYAYLLTLPLALHIPSMHSVIVHAGLVAYDLDKSPNAASQPLIVADRSAFDAEGAQGWKPIGDGSAAQNDNVNQGEEEETDWTQYGDDDSDIPDRPHEEQSEPESHGHGRPAALGRPTAAENGNSDSYGHEHGSTDAHGHGHSSEVDMDTSVFDDDDADAPVRRSTGMSRSGKRRSRPRGNDIRLSTELSILTSLPQNVAPYTLTDMRSLYTHGKKRGKITKSSKKGRPWAEVWNAQMGRCRGDGAWSLTDAVEDELRDVRRRQHDDGDGDVEVERSKLRCSPFTVIYGHAAGRGLDIRPFSKGIDTGCVYGQQLTALVLGDTKGLKGKSVRVDKHKGVLVSVDCKSGGTA